MAFQRGNPLPHKKDHHCRRNCCSYFQKLYSQFGSFNKVISNCGPHFTAHSARELSRILGYKISLSSVYRPQSDIETEWVNRIFCGNNPSEWVDHIPMAEFVHNIHPHSITGKSPFYLILRYKLPALPSLLNQSQLPAGEEHLNTLVKAWEKALATHELTQQTMKSHIQSKSTPFKVGDKVWLEMWNLKQNVIDPKLCPQKRRTLLHHQNPIPYLTNWNSQTHGRSIQCSLSLFLPPISKTISMALTTQLHPLTSSEMRKNMKSSGY